MTLDKFDQLFARLDAAADKLWRAGNHTKWIVLVKRWQDWYWRNRHRYED